MEFHPSLNKRLIIILFLIWIDMGITYATLKASEENENISLYVEEMSSTVGPASKEYGIFWGIIIGGLINTTLILFIALIVRGPVEHGILMGIFIFAIMSNIRLFIYLIQNV